MEKKEKEEEKRQRDTRSLSPKPIIADRFSLIFPSASAILSSSSLRFSRVCSSFVAARVWIGNKFFSSTTFIILITISECRSVIRFRRNILHRVRPNFLEMKFHILKGIRVSSVAFHLCVKREWKAVNFNFVIVYNKQFGNIIRSN